MNIGETSPRKLRALIALLLFGVFLAGAFAGAGFLHWFVHPRPLGPPGKIPPPFSELDLSKEQERKVIEILDKHHSELEEIIQESFPKARKVFDKIDAEVRVILTTAQRKKFEAFKRNHKPFPPGGRGHHKRPPGFSPFGPPKGPPPDRR